MKRRLVRAGLLAAALVLAVYSLFPFYYAFVTSFKVGGEIFRVSFWVESFRLDNYRSLFFQQEFLRIILNSFVVAFLTVLASLALGLTAAFALARVRFPGKFLIMALILGVSMFPQIAVLSGLYFLLQLLHLYNSWFGLALSYLIFTLPFTVWVLTAFIRGLPRELEEAAIMDGATPLQILRQIYLPLLAPATVTTGLLAFIAAWNEFLFALTFTVDERSRTIPVALSLITGASKHELPFGTIMAASVLVTLPLVVLVLIFQRRIVAGLTAGAVKG